MFHLLGLRAAIFSGVTSAARPVDVIYLIPGNELGDDDTISRVPMNIYMSRKTVHPGTCLTSVFSKSDLWFYCLKSVPLKAGYRRPTYRLLVRCLTLDHMA
ncbi:hypothetical protein EDD15DRAFT_2301604 [Pisolithus albus]|nr:hypothetical protein EDD15DRAFT_2301604 [Pisolithus albus]